MHISSGGGPEECALAVAKTFERISAEAAVKHIFISLIDAERSREDGNARSLLLSLEEKGVREFASSWEGTVQWIMQSPYRPHHKRKNWYAGIFVYDVPEEGSCFKNGDVVFRTIRASGPGGQYVNKTDSAVRAIHIPRR